MEKGFLSKGTEDWGYEQFKAWLEPKDFKFKFLVLAAFKVVVRWADDSLADKVDNESMKEQVRLLGDKLREEEWEEAIGMMIVLIPEIVELFKKDEV